MNTVYLSDIPRLFTAAAEWCACLTVIAKWGWRGSACS